MDINDEIAGLVAKVLNDEASAEEKKLLADFLDNNAAAAQQFERLRKVWPVKTGEPSPGVWSENWREPEKLTRLRERARQERAKAIATDIEPRKIRRLVPAFFKYAAAVLAIMICGIAYLKTELAKREKKANSSKEIAAEYGSRKRVMLPDGSTVLLNSGSKLQYCTHFEGKTRDVTLVGEAFFDVVKQPERPFIVHTSDINIKVLGTAFNVKSYPEEDAIETTLIRGLVQINRQEQKEAAPILLHPNQKVTLPRHNDVSGTIPEKITGKEADAKKDVKIVSLGSGEMEKEWIETAWIHNRLEFRKNSFWEIARKMERWYGVTIHISDDSLARQIFNGSFENETLEQALNALQKTIPFTFKINNNEVFIDVSK